MFVSVLITGPGTGDLRRCLACLGAQTYVNFEIIVAAQTGESIAFADPRCRAANLEPNLGMAAIKNRLAAQARGQWLCFMDAATYPEPEWLMSLMSAARRYPQAAIFGSVLIRDDDPDLLEGCGINYSPAGFPWTGCAGWPLEAIPDDGEIFAPCPAAALYRADVFQALGGFDEALDVPGDALDFAFRARLAGHAIMLAADAAARHEKILSGGAKNTGIYAMTRDRTRIFVKNMPDILFWPFLPFHILGNALRLACLPTALLRWEGMVAAARQLPAIWRGRKAEIIAHRRFIAALGWSPIKRFWRLADTRSF